MTSIGDTSPASIIIPLWSPFLMLFCTNFIPDTMFFFDCAVMKNLNISDFVHHTTVGFMKSSLCWELVLTCMQLTFFCPSSNQQLCLSISRKIFLFHFFLLNNEFHDASWCLFILQKSFQWPMTHKLKFIKTSSDAFDFTLLFKCWTLKQ